MIQTKTLNPHVTKIEYFTMEGEERAYFQVFVDDMIMYALNYPSALALLCEIGEL